jgi:putative endonuclease
MDTKELGNLGEKLACEYLVKNGYKIIGRNYRINFGEIDIIAKKKWKLFSKNDDALHFVEVKTSQGPSLQFYPEQRVDWKKQNKYKRLAEVWLSKNKLPENIPYQIDIIAVSFDELGKPEINHFGNVVGGKN